MKRYEEPGDLTAGLRAALADWLLAVADNKHLLGLRYAEWCTGAPELEADIAASAMAQYELGHARLLRGVLADLPEDPQDGARDEDPASWRNLPLLDRPFRSWTELVVANALLDTLLTVNLQAAAAGAYQPLAQRLRKAVAEEQYHQVHARAWFRRIAVGGDEAVAALRSAVEEAWPQCVAWFGPPEEDNALDLLAGAGVLDAGAAALRDRYLEEIVPLFEDTALPPPARKAAGRWELQAELEWEGWSEASRRHGTPRFDAACFRMLTGAETRAMGVRD